MPPPLGEPAQSGEALQSPQGSPPDPQGLVAAGVTATPGHLDGSEGAELVTGMSVYPWGVGSDLGTKWIFTTGTNRVDKFMEIVGIYTGDGGGSLGVFDTSCSVQYPCVNPVTSDVSTGPAWVLVKDMLDMPCYYEHPTQIPATGDWHAMNWYRNRTEKLDSGGGEIPPLWRNTAMFANYCTFTWDIVYQHDYRSNQGNCAALNCAWWINIIETLPREWVPIDVEISKLAFDRSALFLAKAGEPQGLLSPDHTDFNVGPAIWQGVNHLTSNHTWGRGSYYDSDQDAIWDPVDPDDDEDGSPDTVEPSCGANALDTRKMPERIDGIYSGRDEDGSGVDEPLPAGSESWDCDGDGFTGSTEQWVFERASAADDQAACAETDAPADEADDRWPADFNDTRTVGITDVLAMKPAFGTTTRRYDLAPGGGVGISDVLAMKPLFGRTCTTPLP